MRAYFFGNMYLSSIQQGIQAQHCTVELYNKYFPTPLIADEECTFLVTEQAVLLADWAHNHKTDILLNGGYSETLHTIHDNLEDLDNPYPYACFNEGKDSLDGALTCVGIILPEEIYTTAAEVRGAGRRGKYGRDKVSDFDQYGEWTTDNGMNVYAFTKWQVWLINELNNYGLAR